MRNIMVYLFALSLAACHFRVDRKQLSHIRQLPGFRIISVDSTQCINTENIANGHPTIFFYFDPDCTHCQRLTKELLQHITQLRDTKLYWVTNGDEELLKRFYKFYHLDTMRNIMVGKDYEYSFYRTYLPPAVPYMAIYNDRKNLVKIYKGEIDVNSIVEAVRE